MDYCDYIKEASSKVKELFDGKSELDAELVSLKKNDILLKQGDVCKYYYFVKSGILRNYYLKDGIEVITSFTFPDDFDTNLQSALMHAPSTEFIQAVTNSEVYQVDINEFEMFKLRHPEMHGVEMVFYTAYTLLLEERLMSLQYMTAAERYNFLLKNYPKHLHKIPLTYVASYLGITLETLSRIRAGK